MTTDLSGDQSMRVEYRTSLFVILVFIINLVMDGPPAIASPFHMQLILLPITATWLICSFYFLFRNLSETSGAGGVLLQLAKLNVVGWIIVVFEILFTVLFVYQTRHFAEFGYRFTPLPTISTLALLSAAVVFAAFRSNTSLTKIVTYLAAYATNQVLSVLNFPLNYRRSDMLPVIFWADRALISGRNAYQHFYVAERIYDFPYLPGTLLTFLPAQALHIDLRWACIAYLVAGMGLIYHESAPRFRTHVSALIGLFLLCPYLQYRHDLYTQPYFFSLILVFVLLNRGLFGWSSAAFGLSMVISQFSWVIFPFFLLNALRRNGWREVARTFMIAAVSALVFLAPFLHAGAGSIAHNAVGQWDRLERAIARPINLAFWATYIVRPSSLKWLQLGLLSAMFLYCWVKGRCSDLADTLRWMILALLTFILFNVLVDGYFYLMLMIPMLTFTCVANGWWSSGGHSRLRAEPLT